jgi:hypothetical protein
MGKIAFRSHHFLCTLGFEGKGYSPGFVENYQRIADTLRGAGKSGDQVRIEVTGGLDSICAPCPNNQGTSCATQAKIETLDAAHARVLGLSPGDVITWGEVKTLIAEKFTDEAFDRACAPCGWKALGYCKSALERNRNR